MTANTNLTVEARALTDFVSELFVASGISETSARTVAASLVQSDLEGLHSHGVMLVEMYLDRIRGGSVSALDQGEVVSDNGACVVIDAKNALGQVVAEQAMDIAIDRAKNTGMGVTAVRNGFHFGATRTYTNQAANAGCIGIAMCNTRPLMPAPGGATRVVGNNPLAISLPCRDAEPLALDMAMSEAAMGKIRMAAKLGQPIPQTWAADSTGAPTTDPKAAIEGMLLPTAGHKGYGLALIINLMCSLLSGGAGGAAVKPLYGDPSEPYASAQLFMAIDIAHFLDPAVFQDLAQQAIDDIRNGPRAPGVERLFTPGEPEFTRRQAANGSLNISAEIAQTLTKAAGDLGVGTSLFSTN